MTSRRGLRFLQLMVSCWLIALPGSGASGVSIVEFGAIGDGITDNTEAIRKAFASQTKSVYVPAGRYLTTPLDLPDGVHLYGDGSLSVLVLNAKDRKPYLLASGNHCVIERLALTSDDEQIKSTNQEDPCLIHIRGKSDVTIMDVQLSNYPYTGIGCWQSTDLKISRNRLTNLNEAIRLRLCWRVQVMSNTIMDMKFHGIEFWGITDEDYAAKEHRQHACGDLMICNNYVKEGGGGAIWGAGAVRVIMNNNIIDGASDIGLDLEGCDDSVIVGNSVRNCFNAGIALFNACKRVSISGNTVINDHLISEAEAKKDWWVRSGIWLTNPNRGNNKLDHGHRDVAIVGNTIWCKDDGPRRAMWIGAESDNVTIANNTLRGGGVTYVGEHDVDP